MKTLLWAEGLKVKRSKILWIAFFATIMVTVIVYMLGQFLFNGQRYIDGATWYMDTTHSLGSLYVFPAIISLVGSYLICREEQEGTLKFLYLIPISLSKLVIAKMIMTALFSIILYTVLFIITVLMEGMLHISSLTFEMVLYYARVYILGGICLFIAVSPVIAFVYKLKKGYWLALVFAEIYSFAGIFMGMHRLTRSIYPITAAFGISGYYETTTSQFILSFFSLGVCTAITFVILRGLDREDIL